MTATMSEGKKGKHRPAQSFIERTLSGISDALEQTLFADEIPRADGFLQALDPRVKLLARIAFLLAINLSRNLSLILGIYLLTLPVALCLACAAGLLLEAGLGVYAFLYGHHRLAHAL